MKISLKAARINSNLTQMQVAEKIGVHYQTYRNWESGKTKPDYEQMEKLSKLLKIDVKKLKL